MKVVKGFTLRSLKNAADVVVFPFEEIVNSVSVILAMSYGKAVIAPDMGSMPGTTDKKGSFFYDRNDKSGLFNALNKALNFNLISMGK